MERNAIKQRKIAKVCGHKISYGHLFLSPNKSFRYCLILFIGKVFRTSFYLQEMREVIQWHWKEQRVKGRKILIMRIKGLWRKLKGQRREESWQDKSCKKWTIKTFKKVTNLTTGQGRFRHPLRYCSGS